MPKAPKYIIERVWTAELPKTLTDNYLEERGFQLPKAIFPDIRVLTANKGTQNDTFYPEESLKGDPERNTGLISFNRPYPVPILRDHLDTPSAQGGHSSDVYGRIYHPAQIHADKGEKYLRCMATITHPEAVEAILTGRWLTVSLGSKTDSVTCSICKGELTEGLCEHQKGKMYEIDDKPDKQKALWIIGPIRAREVSFVVSPSDDQAAVITPNLKESASNFNKSIPRLLVGDDKGVFDLATGVKVAESDVFSRVGTGKFFGGLSFVGRDLKESVDSKKKRIEPLEEISDEEAARWMKEDFIGPGKYLLSGWDHDHTVVLDQRGDGVSTPGKMPPTSRMEPGYMYPTMSAEAGAGAAGPVSQGPARGRGMGDGDNGGPNPAPTQVGDEEDHTHEVLGGRVMKAGYPTHAHDLEPAHAALESQQITKDDKVLTMGELYMLPKSHPEFAVPDNADEMNEAVLTNKSRSALPGSAFCGPNSCFPADNEAHISKGLSLISESTLSPEQKERVRACLLRKGKAFGMSTSSESVNTNSPTDDQPVTLGQLYHLPSDHPDFDLPDDVEVGEMAEAKLTYSARKSLPGGAFCGPDRSFPAHDAAHVRNGLARLSQSSLSSEQKARVHGCLSGRAKKYGIKVGGKENYAAKLVDTQHHIEIQLYVYPASAEEAALTVNKVKSMPHTPSEKEQILSRIAAHCKDIIPMSKWQELFGELPVCEAGDPISIEINNENYGLLYTLSQVSAQAESDVDDSKESTEDCGCGCGNTEDEDEDKSAEVKEVESDGGLPVVHLPKEAAKTADLPDTLDPEQNIVRQAITSLQKKASESEATARLALSHSAAIYMKALRKPLSRGKTSEELIELLSQRSTESLKDTINDLLQELEAVGAPALQLSPTQPIQKLENPAEPTVDPSASKKKEAAPSVDTPEESPKARGTTVDQTDEEEEKTRTTLGILFKNLEVKSKK